MLLLPNPYTCKRIMEERVRDRLHEAETRRLLREAGIDQRSQFSRLACRLLSWVGRLLVAVGRQLEHLEGAREDHLNQKGIPPSVRQV